MFIEEESHVNMNHLQLENPFKPSELVGREPETVGKGVSKFPSA